jgi:hypothetical protein
MVRGAFRVLQSDVILSDQFLQSQDTGVSRCQVAHVCSLIRLYPVLDAASSSDRSGFGGIRAYTEFIPRFFASLVAFKATETSQLTRWVAKSVLSLQPVRG